MFKKSGFLWIIFLSLSSWSDVVMHLEHEDYYADIHLIESKDDRTQGDVELASSLNKKCLGQYVLNMSNGLLDIVFASNGESGRCLDENFSIYVGNEDYLALLQGHTITVNYSAYFRLIFDEKASIRFIQL